MVHQSLTLQPCQIGNHLEFQEQLPEAQTSEHKIVFDPKYMLVGDTVDLRTQRQHYLIEKGIVDRHFFNLIVVSNRISSQN